MSKEGPDPLGGPDIMRLGPLLAGLGGNNSLARMGASSAAARHDARMCIDGGASALIAVAAPGPRVWEAHVLASVDAEAGSQDWAGTRIGPERVAVSLERRLYRGRSHAPVAYAEAIAADHAGQALSTFRNVHRQIGPSGRIYSVGREHIGTRYGIRIGWQIDRHVDVRDLLSPLVGAGNWAAAASSLADVHGFDLQRAGGPWSLSLDIVAPERGWRVGSTRWARALDDTGKRKRLTQWIASHGGDAAYAGALHDLIRGSADNPVKSIGRAVEVDVAGGQVIAAIAYLGTASLPSRHTPDNPAQSDRR